MAERKAILLGISGVSSSGKTTLARLLRDIFPRAFVLHEDDFYKTDAEIPVKNGIQDWDCSDSINIPAFQDTLRYILEHGELPRDFVSKEDKNSVGDVDVDSMLVKDLQWKAAKWAYQDAPPIAIIDGFLLYSEEMKAVRDLFDVKIFLRADYATMKARREARSGYVTLEGFWEDPPDYVDDVVWPNYVKYHSFLFQRGEVDGPIDEQTLQRLGIQAMPSNAHGNITACLRWANEVLDGALDTFISRPA